MTGLSFVGHGNATLNNTIDAIEQSNSKLNSTTYGHMFEKNITNLSEVNHSGQNKTDGGHQDVIFWALSGLCVLLFFAWLCFIFHRKLWNKIVHNCPVPKSQAHRSSENTGFLPI